MIGALAHPVVRLASAKCQIAQVLRLQTLGNVFVIGSSGPLGGAASQRRTLALLAALAAAGEGGLSRDKLVGLLWPEASPERARHSLTQALYAARRALDADDLFLVNSTIRLNRGAITCDVQELEAALGAGDLEQAVELYLGPFLDGFFLTGSPEFEQWSSLQRARLEVKVTEALERLADRAELEGDSQRILEWRRRLAVIRPLDSGNALKLMKVMMDLGDRAGALQHAQLHELMLREQLDLEPDPAVVGFANKLREPAEHPAESSAEPVLTPLVSPAGELVLAGAGGPAIESTSFTPAAAHAASWLRGHRSQALSALVVLLALLVAGLVLVRSRTSPAVARRPLQQNVVVAPFRVVGAAASLGYLREGIVELLSTRLADDTAARTVDAGAVLRAWDDAGVSGSASLPRDSIVKLAAKLGAERVVIGSVIGSPQRMIVRASVAAVPSGAGGADAVVEGPADSISRLIDGLAAKLLVSEAGEDEGVASYTTSSLRALRAYLAGQREMRRNHYVEAMGYYRTALTHDPGFALAGLRLALAADRLNQVEERRQGISTAWGSRRSLSERDLALLISYAGPRYPLPSPSAEQLTVWRHLIELTPNNAESWYHYGAHVFHSGALVGVAEPEEQALMLLQRALAIDREYMPAKLLVAQLATRFPASAELEAERVAVESSNPFAPYLRWRLAVATGDSAAVRRIRGTLRGVGPANLRAIAMASQFDGAGLGDGALALGISQSRTTSLSEQIDLVLGQHSLALLQGRPRAAFEVATRLAVLQPGSQAYLRLRVLDALYAEGDTAAASGAARQLERLVSGGATLGAFATETRLANLCILGQWRLSRGDTVGMASSIEALGRAGGAGQFLYPVSTPAPVCASLLHAWLANLNTPGDALPLIERVDTLALTPEVAGDAISYAPILVARLYERAGHPRRALHAIRKRIYMSGWPRYLATVLREEGRLAELNGDRASARESYDRYLALRSSPDSSALPQVEQVRSRRGAL